MDEFDEQLFQEVLDAIENDRRIVVAGLEITGGGGRVVLSGTVQSEEARKIAERVAESVPNVSFVKNNLRVRGGTETRANEAAVRRIKEALTSNPQTIREDIKVSVEEGVLVLEGAVGGLHQKELIAGLLRNMQGLPAYTLRIAILPRRSISDEAVAWNVLRELDRQDGIDINSLNVSVEKGVVTLSGAAASYSGKAAACEAALMCPGVTEVRDRMEVRPVF